MSLLERACREDDDDDRRRAFEELIRIYRDPCERVAAVQARRFGIESPSVEELFAVLWVSNTLANVLKRRRRLSAFLQVTIRHIVQQIAARERRSRRDIPLELIEDPAQAGDVGLGMETEETVAWISGLVEETLKRLGQEHPKGEFVLRAIALEERPKSIGELAEQFGDSDEGMRKFVERSRGRFLFCLETVLSQGERAPEYFDEELKWCLSCLAAIYPDLLRRSQRN